MIMNISDRKEKLYTQTYRTYYIGWGNVASIRLSIHVILIPFLNFKCRLFNQFMHYKEDIFAVVMKQLTQKYYKYNGTCHITIVA